MRKIVTKTAANVANALALAGAGMTPHAID